MKIDEIEESKQVVKDFIGDMFYCDEDKAGKEIAYLNKDNYRYFMNFNFDWLNIPNKESLSNKINSNFRKLTELDEKKLLLLTNKKIKERYRGNATDPDNMNIVRHIMISIYGNILTDSYESFYKINEKRIEEIKKIGIENKERYEYIKLTLDSFNHINNIHMIRPDTMNSFKGVVGTLKPAELNYGRKQISHIYKYHLIDGFTKINADSICANQIAKKFFNSYHTIGNFMILPNEEIIPFLETYKEYARGNNNKIIHLNTINKYRGMNLKGTFGKDDLYKFLKLLEATWDKLIINDKEGCKSEVMKCVKFCKNNAYDNLVNLLLNNIFFF